MTQYLLPILLLAVPVLVVVGLAVLFGRRLSGSCGGSGPDGTCARCGRQGDASTESQPGTARRGSCS